VRPDVLAVWKRLQQPIALGSGACLQLTPESVTQSHPRLGEGELSTRLAASGRVGLLPKCPEPPPDAPERPLPPLQTEPTLPQGSALRVPFTRAWSELNADLARSLQAASTAGQPPAEPRIADVTMTGAEVDGQPRLVLEVHLAGQQCGTLWLLGEAWHDAPHARIRLRKLEPMAQGLTGDAAREARDLAARIERHGAMALPAELESATARLRKLSRELGANQPEDLQLSIELGPPRVERVVPTPDGLVLVAAIDATLTASAK
jgi:hypothetical protein